ncbi:GNAT family N-acetyltransferase [candidate division KSB1 bacterium]|nr:GNAT family N-acetyltransferase [candidate division KSB1 bacterium]
MPEPLCFLKGERVCLRPVEPDDAEMVYAGKNQHARDALFLYFPLTLDQIQIEQKHWIENRETLLFTICTCSNGEAVGQTAFVRWDMVSRAAIFYLAIYHTNHWSKGYGSEAVRLMCRYGFEILNLNRIQLVVSSENAAAVRVYEKAGFRIEGTLRQAMYRNGRYIDFHVMGLLREEYTFTKESDR